jgi:signal transduction histidine kinase
MPITQKHALKNPKNLIFDVFIPAVVFIYLLIALSQYFFVRPYLGFLPVFDTGKILNIYTAPTEGPTVQRNDILLKVGEKPFADDYIKNLDLVLFKGQKTGDVLPLLVERDGQQLQIDYIIPPITTAEILDRLVSQWFLPFLFWLAGLTVILFIRPRNKLYRLLISFFMVNAVWLMAGSLSSTHLGFSAFIMRIGVWMTVPIFIQLHWNFPKPFKKKIKSGWVWLLYFGAGLLAAANVAGLLPGSTYFIGFLISISSIIILLSVHFIRQPEERQFIRNFLLAITIAILPAIGIALANLFGVEIWFTGLAVLGITALPTFYISVIFQKQFPFFTETFKRFQRFYLAIVSAGTIMTIGLSLIPVDIRTVDNPFLVYLLFTILFFILLAVSFVPLFILPALAQLPISFSEDPYQQTRLSANQAAAFIFYQLTVVSLITILSLIAAMLMNLSIGVVPFMIVISIFLISITIPSYRRFQRFFNQKVLGMSFATEKIVPAYSQRITTSLKLDELNQLITKEIMPSLLVRQFTCLQVKSSNISPLFTLGIPDTTSLAELPKENLFDPHNWNRILYKPKEKQNLPNWIRLILPLQFEKETIGLWLFGYRDPDDRYSVEDIAILQSLADQTSLALINIEQAEMLHAFHLANIDRNETERVLLAAELHDDVLNELAVLSNTLDLDNASEHAQNAYDNAIQHIRTIINGLRPPLLTYGLQTGLEGLVDDCLDRYPDAPEICFELKANPEDTVHRYDRQIEQQTFRIIQQACYNALAHANAQKITIDGQFSADAIQVTITDDGNGFDISLAHDLTKLLENKHFGLAGMFERAEIIGADLEFRTAPSEGCQICLKWQQNG